MLGIFGSGSVCTNWNLRIVIQIQADSLNLIDLLQRWVISLTRKWDLHEEALFIDGLRSCSVCDDPGTCPGRMRGLAGGAYAVSALRTRLRAGRGRRERSAQK